MRTRSKVAVTVAVLLLIAGVAAADALTKESTLTGQLKLWLESDGAESSSSVAAESSSSADAAPAVLETLVARGFTFEQKDEPSFLRQLVPSEALPTYVLLQNGDRAGSLVWLQTSESAAVFQSLKESLIQSFSPELQDLRDETVDEPGKPVRSVVTFLDPQLSEERLVFVKTGDTLFEVHVAAAAQDAVLPLIDTLTSR